MDDLDDLQASEFVTDTEDQDSLDERIDSEQRHCNQQLWASFQNAACCITKLYKERAQPNLSPWIPFQNAASNLTTLYKDCIESQRRFARIGYQVGKRKKSRELAKLIKKYKVPSKQHAAAAAAHTTTDHSDLCSDDMLISMGQQHNHQLQHNHHEASILAVNQLNLGCDDLTPSHSMQAQPSNQPHVQAGLQANTAGAHTQQHPLPNMHILASNNEDDLVTFQQALVQPAVVRGNKSSQTRRTCPNSSNYHTNRMADPKTEEERLLELNQFLSEEYHRHVGSKKRSCSTLGGSSIKRFRE